MRKTMIGAMALSTTALLSPAFVMPALAEAIADKDACNKLAFDLAEKAAGKKLPKADAVKVDGLITKLEGECGDGKLAEAEASVKEIETELAK